MLQVTTWYTNLNGLRSRLSRQEYLLHPNSRPLSPCGGVKHDCSSDATPMLRCATIWLFAAFFAVHRDQIYGDLQKLLRKALCSARHAPIPRQTSFVVFRVSHCGLISLRHPSYPSSHPSVSPDDQPSQQEIFRSCQRDRRRSSS